MSNFFSILFFLVMFVLLSKDVHAYLDLGTGSYVFQMVLGGILGALFTLKLYYHKIVKFFKKVNLKEGNDKGKQDGEKK